MANAIISKSTWNEGWIAIKTTLRLDAEHMDTDLLIRLQKLEALLAPKNLFESARAYTFCDVNDEFSLIEMEDEEIERGQHNKIEEIRLEIAREVAKNETVLNKLIPELMTIDVPGAGLCSFARGLAEGCENPLEIWEKFRTQLSTISVSEQRYTVLICFFHSVWSKKPELAEQILDKAVKDEVLGACFPMLQLSVTVSHRGAERLKESLNIGIASAQQYERLAWNRNYESICNDDLCAILRMLAIKPDGLIIAIHVLCSIVRKNKDNNLICNKEMAILGQELLKAVEFDRKEYHSNSIDYKLAQLAEAFLADNADVAAVICQKLTLAIMDCRVYPRDYTRLLRCIVIQQPKVFLDNFLANSQLSKFTAEYLFIDYDSPKLLSLIKDEVIIEWCEKNPITRYPKIASYIASCYYDKDKDRFEWIPLSLAIMDKAPNVEAILNAFKRNFEPSTQTGRGCFRSNSMKKHLPLIAELKTHKNSKISEWAKYKEKEYIKEIQAMQESEEARTRQDDERFE